MAVVAMPHIAASCTLAAGPHPAQPPCRRLLAACAESHAGVCLLLVLNPHAGVFWLLVLTPHAGVCWHCADQLA